MSYSFTSSFENIDKSSKGFLEDIMSEAIAQKDKLQYGDDNSDASSDSCGLDEALEDILGEKKEQEQEQEQDRDRERRVVSVPSERVEKLSGFRHSIYAFIVKGNDKGKEVEIKYTIPGKLEIEIGVNEEIYTSKDLSNGDMIDNCIILAVLGKNRYLGHCRKVTFLKEKDVFKYDNENVKIMMGELAGIHGIIRKEYKTKIGVTFNGIPLTVDESDIFYKDLLLKNGKYFNVVDVKLDNGKYVITGREFGDNNIKQITNDDIQEMMSGFKMQSNVDVEYVGDDVSFRHSERSETGSVGSFEDFDISSQKSNLEVGDYEYDTGDGEQSTFRDMERTSRMFSGWSSKQKSWMDLVKKIMKTFVITEELNTYDLVDQIESVLGYFDNKIISSGENFDIYSSSIDVQMIIACIVVYSLVSMDEHFGGFDNYISELYGKGYFSGRVVESVLVELPDVFVCSELRRTKLDFDRVKMLMNCYNRMIQDILGVSLDLVPRVEVRKFEPIMKKVDKYSKKTFILPDDLIDGLVIDDENMNMNILWSPQYMKRIEKWRNTLLEKMRESSGTKSRIYDFIQKNIENSVKVSYRLRGEVITFLRLRYLDFASVLSNCDGDRKCEDDHIVKYIKKVFDEVLDKSAKGKFKAISQDEYELLQKYMRLGDFIKEFLSDMGKLRDYLKSTREKNLEEISTEKKKLLERRRIISEQREKKDVLTVVDKIKMILGRTFKDTFDETCKDDNCKTKEVVEKARRVLSNQEQMLLTSDEVAMFKKFVSDNSDNVPNEQKKIPKIILKLRKPEPEPKKIPKIILKLKKPESEEKPKIILKLKKPKSEPKKMPKIILKLKKSKK